MNIHLSIFSKINGLVYNISHTGVQSSMGSMKRTECQCLFTYDSIISGVTFYPTILFHGDPRNVVVTHNVSVFAHTLSIDTVLRSV